ncbi:hypothetical protein [Archaeoglobus sp.]
MGEKIKLKVGFSWLYSLCELYVEDCHCSSSVLLGTAKGVEKMAKI